MFLGADTEQLRSQGDHTSDGARRVSALLDGLRHAVAAAEWHGPDAEAFRERAAGAMAAGGSAAEGLSGRAAELHSHAEEQDAASGAGEGDGGREADGAVPAGKKVEDDGSSEGSEPLEEDIPLEGDDTQIENTGQGSIADCYLLSSLGAIVQQDPDFLDRHVTETSDGVYEVTMYDADGEEVTYIVESTPEDGARLDTDEGGHSVYSIYERAYQMHLEQQGDGDTLDWGMEKDAMQTMTGQDASFHDSGSTPPIGDLAELLENGRPVTASTGGIDEPAHEDIAGQHVYKVSAVDEEKGTVTVVNPWSGNEQITMSYDEYVETFNGSTVGRSEAPSAGDRIDEFFDGTWRY